MSKQSGGTSGPGRFFASIYDAINNCPLEQLDAIIVAMFFFVGGGLLIGAIFIGNLVGYFTPIAKNTSHPHYAPVAAQPVYAQPYAMQQVYPAQMQADPARTAQAHGYPPQVQSYPAPVQAYSLPTQSYPAQVQAYEMPVVGSNWSSPPQHFGRPRSASQGWYPFAQERFGQAEASNQPPM